MHFSCMICVTIVPKRDNPHSHQGTPLVQHIVPGFPPGFAGYVFFFPAFFFFFLRIIRDNRTEEAYPHIKSSNVT